MTARMNRRIYGLLGKRLDEIGFDEVRDDRGERGKRWQLGALLRTVTGAMLSGAKSLAEVEALSERMSTPIRKLLGIGRRVPDTTLRDALTTVEPCEIEAHPRAAFVVAILRRIAYTLLSLFRSVTQRSDERRAVAWKALMADVFFALVTTTAAELEDLRRHRVAELR